MKIVCMKGGLGNQLFEYCFYRYMRKKNGGKDVYLYYDHARLKEHGGLQLSNVFDIDLPARSADITLIVWGIKMLRLFKWGRKLWDDTQPGAILIDDYCQDKRYQEEIKLPTFRYMLYHTKTMRMREEIEKSAFAVSLHVRRGDYLLPGNKEAFGCCDESYYQRAVERIKKEYPQARFFLFSDDKEWLAQEGLPGLDATPVISGDEVNEGWDMELMSLCRGHVIANSTYSYWGARLAPVNSITIYPEKWYAHPEWKAPDIFPEEWIKM